MNRMQKGVIALAVGLCLTGCETMETMPDDNRTKTEGAAAGALAGALLGLAIGDNRKGAAIGAVVGGVAGYLIGTEVAKRKQQYASDEAFLDAEIDRTRGYNAEARTHHEETRTEIARLDKESKSLRSKYDKGKVDADRLRHKQEELEQQVAQNREMQERLQKEYEVNLAIIEEEGKARSADDPYIARLEKENAELKRQIESLQQDGEQMARINDRLSI